MKNELLNKYKKAFINFINDTINFNKYDEKIKNSNLHINNTLIENDINSKYYYLLNNLYIENLDENDKEIILNKRNIDEELTNIIKRTYINILKKENVDVIIYKNSHQVKNTTLVLNFIYGKNNLDLEDDEYIALSNKQREFINEINIELKKEIEEKLNIKCEIFIEKRL